MEKYTLYFELLVWQIWINIEEEYIEQGNHQNKFFHNFHWQLIIFIFFSILIVFL